VLKGGPEQEGGEVTKIGTIGGEIFFFRKTALKQTSVSNNKCITKTLINVDIEKIINNQTNY
jgi:hypothetical protein